MSIGILTYHFANNYGAVLQAYSLQSVFREMGVETEFVDFHSKLQTSNNSLFLDVSTPENLVKNIVRLPHYAARKKRIQKFNEFRNKCINISDRSFSVQSEAIEYIENRYSSIVVGSDQIWNPSAPDFDSIYFHISRIKIPTYAYAVSLGTAKERNLSQFKNDILQFSDISVREESSVDILKNVDERIKALGVLDPTLLPNAEFFKKIAREPQDITKDYVVCYYLGRKNAVKFKKAANNLAIRFGLDIYYINANYGLTSYGKEVVSDCGPEEFLGYLKNAKLVCTNSFHAVALSIQLGVPFFSFESSDLQDTRKIDLLKRINITDRIIPDFDVSNVEEFSMPDIDIESRLLDYRIISFEYLKNIIQK